MHKIFKSCTTRKCSFLKGDSVIKFSINRRIYTKFTSMRPYDGLLTDSRDGIPTNLWRISNRFVTNFDEFSLNLHLPIKLKGSLCYPVQHSKSAHVFNRFHNHKLIKQELTCYVSYVFRIHVNVDTSIYVWVFFFTWYLNNN